MASKNPQVKPPSNPNQRQILTQSQQWSGPLPPPAALDQFNQIIPNGAERIMSMVEREQAHRLEAEGKILRATIGDTQRGHWMGLLIAVGSIAAAVWTVHIGAHPTVSIALVGLPLVAIVKSIIGSKTNGK